jgi:putative iron-dependent peroxidase
MSFSQGAVLADVSLMGSYVFFELWSASAPVVLQGLVQLNGLATLEGGERLLLGVGVELLQLLNAEVPCMRTFLPLSGAKVSNPATPAAIVCWLCGADRGELVHLQRRVERALSPAFRLTQTVDAFRHGSGANGHGRDLTGYEDGAENPTGFAAAQGVLGQGAGSGLDGSSFMAVQQWLPDLNAFDAQFDISRPISSANFWCPPMRADKLDMRQLGL